MAESEPAEVTIDVMQEQNIEEKVSGVEMEGETTETTPEVTGGQDELPPLTYIDFLPQCLGSAIEGKEPMFAEFGTVVEQANQWLTSMPQFSVYKCETLEVKLGHEFKPDADLTLLHRSSNGRNVYIRGLRLWLIPKAEGAPQAVQQLAYVTVLPDHTSGNLKGFLENLAGNAVANTIGEAGGAMNFDTLSETVDKLNKHLQAKPLPGKILTVETVAFKAQESNTSDKLNTETCSWSEKGSNSRFYLYALRLFYVLGQPAYETIGLYDEEPETMQNMEGIGLKVKFSSFGAVVTKATQWLQQQQGVRVVNVQSVNIKLERKYGNGPWVLNTNSPGFTVTQSLQETRYTKVLRIAYIKDQKLDNPSPYAAMTMTSRLFAPQKIDNRQFESFSKTMLRAIKWLNATRIPLFACETVQYPVNTESYGVGYDEDRVDSIVNTNSGRYFITCIRLYFPSVYQEPPEEIETSVESGWGCVIS